MWKPISLFNLLNQNKPLSGRVVGTLAAWIILTYSLMWGSIYILPADWVSMAGDRTDLLQFFLLNPSLLISLLILFWFGFEWAFVPVFLSMYMIGIFSHLEFYWSILFSLSFVFGLSIYAIVYHCIDIRYDLRSVYSAFVFIITSFVFATASSLGAFTWSLVHGLTAEQTALIWNGWWTGSFLQAIVIAGPILYLFSAKVEKLKAQYFEVPKRKQVSAKWVYSAVILITACISIFIYFGDYLGKKRLSETLSSSSIQNHDIILNSLGTFEIITWVSIWIVVCVGLGGIFLIGSWNKELSMQVETRTAQLENTKLKLKESLDEKVVMLQEIHHRVKNNLAVVSALLDLQLLRTKNAEVTEILSDSKSRVKTLAFVHENLYQTKNFSRIGLRPYLNRMCSSIVSTYKRENKKIDIIISLDDMSLDMNKAVPVGLILNELIVNSYKHAFCNKREGKIEITMWKNEEKVHFNVTDDGVGIDKKEKILEEETLGMTLINTLASQLKADIKIDSDSEKTSVSVSFDKSIIV